MLTQNEKRWLRERTKFPVFSCSHCAEGRPMLEKHCVCYDVYPCAAENLVSTKDDVLEAAKFESRVAAKLAKAFKEYVKRRNCVDFEVGTRCPGWEVCAANYKKRLPCDFAIMKGVQLKVEEEMDAD